MLRGKFYLKLDKKLTFKSKVEKFANDPLAFYLHKNNDFFRRLKKHQKLKDDEDVHLEFQ